jgi:hypothetical protein
MNIAMKFSIFLVAIIVLVISGCITEKKSPLEGAWKQVGFDKQFITDTSLQGMIKIGQIKTFSKKYFTFVGHFADDTSSFDSYGAGTYTLNGDKYEEMVIFHNSKDLVGKNYKGIDKIRNDTLFHTHQVDDNWKLMEGAGTEIYVRLK